MSTTVALLLAILLIVASFARPTKRDVVNFAGGFVFVVVSALVLAWAS